MNLINTYQSLIRRTEEVFSKSSVELSKILGLSIINNDSKNNYDGIGFVYPSDMCDALVSAINHNKVAVIEKDGHAGTHGNVLLQSKKEHNNSDSIMFSPIDKIKQKPDVVFVCGMPEEIMKLVHGALYKSEGVFVPTLTAGCDSIIKHEQLRKLDECQIIDFNCLQEYEGLNSNGELAFTIPWDLLEDVLIGLEEINDNSIYYPNDKIDFTSHEEFTILWD